MAEPVDSQARAEEILARHALSLEGGQHAIGDKAPTVAHCSCGAVMPEAEDRTDAFALWNTHLGMLSEEDQRDRHWALLVSARSTSYEDS